MFDGAPCGLLQTDGDGTILRANKTLCGWLGVVESEMVAGQLRLHDLLTVGARIFFYTHLVPLLRMQGAVAEVKLELVRRDRTGLPVIINAARREHDGVEVHDIACFVVHDRDLYEREMLKTRKRLEELVAELSSVQAKAIDRALLMEQMMGIVSHDLRNPLSSIAMAAELVERGALNEGQARNVARIKRASARATLLIADLLDFTQVRLGNVLSTTRVPIDLHHVIAECVDELAVAYSGRKLEHIKRGEGACVADRDRLVQLAGNLVSNAMTYGDPSAAVTVTSSIEDTAFIVSVHNEGPPIAPSLLAHIFEPLTRGSSAGSAQRSLGLGLFIVSEIAKAHYGVVDVTSTADEGTTFRATFPRLH